RVELLARLVQDLNGRLFEQAWQLIAPPELVQNSCLLVMGSEGRGEQLLKTDQDNALLLRDGYVPPDDLPAICARFSEALARFGYPPCPGNVMLSNATWRGTVQDFARRVRKWLVLPEADSMINLAVFMDAHAVCGDAELLASLRRQVFGMLADDDAMMSRFAAVVDAFGDGTRWWRRMLGGGEANLNVKKAGMFPLVHGVRSMALAERIDATSTEARIRALHEAGALDAETAQELTESLHFFMGLRLKAGLDEMDRGQPVSGKVDLAGLTPLERDLLKDALAAVRRFRAQLRLRFRLGAVS
ncbi:MAG: cyclic nucleotide-binding protein, partial [Lautropia mirabilis]|nr:cyclic nucleotide-binding protein [Lautropia mirabilis]